MMTDQELKDLVAGLAVKSDRLDAQIASVSAELRESIQTLNEQASRHIESTNTSIKAVNENLGGMGKSQGMVAEEFFFNSLHASPIVAGIHYDSVTAGLKRKMNGVEAEIDLLLENGKSVALAEVKYRVRTKDVEQVQKTVASFRALFPNYKDYTLYAGIAGFSFEDEALGMAHEQGLFVLRRKGDVVETDGGALRTF